MFPAPTTIATSTPWSRMAVTWRATATTRSGSAPYWRSPISASPESFRSMRVKAGAIAAQSLPASGLLAYGEAGEAAYHDVLAGGGSQLVTQLLDGLALELRVVHDLLEQHDRAEPRVELAGHDPLAHVLRLVRRLLLVDAGLRIALLVGNVLAADVGNRRGGGDLHGDLAGEGDEIVVLGDEDRVAVHLHQHPDLGSRVHIGLHGALRGGPLAGMLDLLPLPDPEDLDGLLDIPLRLGEGLLAVHHARARPVAQGLYVLGCDLDRVHDALASAFVVSFCSVASPAGSDSPAACSASAAGASSPAGWAASSLSGAGAEPSAD